MKIKRSLLFSKRSKNAPIYSPAADYFRHLSQPQAEHHGARRGGIQQLDTHSALVWTICMALSALSGPPAHYII